MTKTFVKAAVIALFSATALVSTVSAGELPSYLTETPAVGTPIATFIPPQAVVDDETGVDADIAEQVSGLFDEISELRTDVWIGGFSGNDRARGKIILLSRKVKAMQSDATTQHYPDDLVVALNDAASRLKDIDAQIATEYERLKADDAARPIKKADAGITMEGLTPNPLLQGLVDQVLRNSMTNLGQLNLGKPGLGNMPSLLDGFPPETSGKREF